jgi:hypothetical protein
MNPEDFKKCSKCFIYKSKTDFHCKRDDCKSCRASKDKVNYKQNKEEELKEKIKGRTPYRNELFKKYLKEANDLEYYKRYYIPFEEYEEMKKQKDKYSFCESEFVREVDREHYKDDYDNKLFLDCVMMNNKDIKSAYVVHII